MCSINKHLAGLLGSRLCYLIDKQLQDLAQRFYSFSHASRTPPPTILGLHDISFQHWYHDVSISDSHIARCALFSILIVIFILIVFFAHTQTPCLHPLQQLEAVYMTQRPLQIIWTSCQYVINRTRHQFTVGICCVALRNIQCSQTASLIIMGSIVFCHVTPHTSDVDTVRATQMHINTEFHSLPHLFEPEMTKLCQNACFCKYPCKHSSLWLRWM